MKQNFDKALQLTLDWEAGWSNDPRDSGGATMRGVTIATYSHYLKREATQQELRNITNEEVRDIYKTLYWNKVRADDLPSGIDYALFDASVNMGVTQAVILMQLSVGATPDGVIGEKTIAAINSKDPNETLNRFTSIKESFYKSLKNFSVYGKGWLRRVKGVKEKATELAGTSDA